MASAPVPTVTSVFCSCIILASILLWDWGGVVSGVCATVVPGGARDKMAAADTRVMQRLRRKGDGMVVTRPDKRTPTRVGAHKDIVVNWALCGGFDSFCVADDYGL